MSQLQTKGAWSSQDQGEARKGHLILDVYFYTVRQ